MYFRRLPALLILATGALAIWPGLAFGGDANNTDKTPATPMPHQLRVMVDPRVELMSLIFRLAGNGEYNMAKVPIYSADADRQFAAFSNHAVVKLATRLREEHGVSFDAVMGMAIHLNNAEQPELCAPLSPWPDGLDSRWKSADVDGFLADARQFVRDADFPKFLRDHQALYQTTTQRMQDFLARDGHLEWFDAYFGRRAAKFTVVPGLLNGGGCYGPHFHEAGGGDEYYCVLGVWKTDAQGLPEFERDAMGTVVHEFCHSYANPLVFRHLDTLESAGDALYHAVSAKMHSQAYDSGRTVLCESLVRVCVIRYLLKYEGDAAADKAVKKEIRNGFLWMDDLSHLMADYEKNRVKYPTLEEFAPRLAAFFTEQAGHIADTVRESSARLPKVISMTPRDGARNVNPGLKGIEVVFDRPMKDGSWSLVGGGEHFPEVGKSAHYDAGHKVWSIPVKLKPDWEYEFMLNSGTYTGFRAADGEALDPVQVSFKTGAPKE